MVGIESEAQEITEITGKPPGDEWLVSILLTVMDKDTKTNVSTTMTTDSTFPHLGDKVRAYATLMGGSPGKGRLCGHRSNGRKGKWRKLGKRNLVG